MIDVEYRAEPLPCCGCGLPSNRVPVDHFGYGLCELCERKYVTPFAWGVWEHPAPDAAANDAQVIPFRRAS
jgi:hypothetical protein